MGSDLSEELAPRLCFPTFDSTTEDTGGNMARNREKAILSFLRFSNQLDGRSPGGECLCYRSKFPGDFSLYNQVRMYGIP
tara:strand:+ start:1548 stop:1787 length:240 start_codon:yes stop_codon:yes gene_type:complete